MDPITTAIISGLAGVGKDAIKDSYNALKGALKKKFGETSDLAEAVDKLEKKPDSEGHKITLQEEVEAANAHEDAEMLQLAQALLDKIKEQSPAQKNTTMGDVNVKGKGNIAIGNVDTNQGSIGGIHGKK